MVKKITRGEFVDMICEGRPMRLLDVLDRSHFEQEHIKGAISMPLEELEAKCKAFHRADRIVVYCAGFECEASTKTAEKLSSLGFTNVLDYKGGIKDYKEGGLPMEGSLHVDETASFPCHEGAAC